MIITELKIENGKYLYNVDTEEDKEYLESIGLDLKEIENIETKQRRYERLEKIFSKKWRGIQAISIDKPYMRNSETIKAQIDSYDKLHDSALLILKSDPKNEQMKEVVKKHDEALKITVKGNLMLQTFRGILEKKIENDDENIDSLLDYSEKIKLSKEDFTDAKMSELYNYLSK